MVATGLRAPLSVGRAGRHRDSLSDTRAAVIDRVALFHLVPSSKVVRPRGYCRYCRWLFGDNAHSLPAPGERHQARVGGITPPKRPGKATPGDRPTEAARPGNC